MDKELLPDHSSIQTWDYYHFDSIYDALNFIPKLITDVKYNISMFDEIELFSTEEDGHIIGVLRCYTTQKIGDINESLV